VSDAPDLPDSPLGRWLFPALVLFAALLAGLPSLGGDFLGDDFGWVFLYRDRSLAEILSLRDISHGVWGGLPLDELRPLFTLSFRLNALFAGSSAFGYHLANVLLHAGNALLVYALGRLLLGRALPALLAALFFALAPGQAEAISWVSGRVDLLPTAFYLASVCAFRAAARSRGFLLLSLVLFSLGLFAKEILLTLPLLLAALELVVPSSPRRSLLRLVAELVPFGLAGAGFLLLRKIVFGNFAREKRVLPLGLFARGQIEDLKTFLPPLDLLHHGTVPLREGLLGALAGLVLLAWAVHLARNPPVLVRAVLLGAVLSGVTLLPLVVTYPSPRHLYLPSVGVCLVLGVAAAPSGSRLRRVELLGVLLVLGAAFHGLARHEAAWVRSGVLSREARAQTASLAPRIPAGSVVAFSGVPNEAGGTMVWDFAMPFALEPPFVPEDLKARFELVFSPGIYCCPVAEWFREEKGTLDALLKGDPGATLTVYSLHWNDRRHAIVGTRGSFPRRELLSRIAALGPGPAGSPEDAAQANRLAPALLEALRSLCGDDL
jgi:hypothetical protein